VNFVLRTRQVLSLTDPAEDRRLRADPDLRDRAPRALLCLPIGRPRAASGALVLESDTFSHAFESGRVEALRVLSEQAISAIDHARLSSDLSTLSDDVAELRSTAATLTTQAETDPLTGVANRLGLESRLQTAIRAAHAPSARRASGVTDPQVGVLFCDLDGFKEVNDQHGHASGDQVLEAVSGRICSAVRGEDIVARVGGDEFVVVSIGVSDAELRRMADRLLLEIAQPIEVRGVTVAISTSIGIGQADLGHVTTTDDVDALVQVADRAMYRAKDEGKNRVGRG
jgi:diguanylate cyclase (GGDEF)-like protein